MTTDLGETFRLALAALRSTVGDAKFREIEKTWVQEHQEQFDPTGLKITATYSDKSTKAIDPTDEAVTYHYDFAKPSGAAKITVTYDGQTASFTVKVTADAGNKTGNNPKQQASPVQNGSTSTQPNGVSNPLSKTGASTAPIIALQHGSDHRPDGTRTADGRRQRGHRMAVRRMAAPGALAVGQRRGRARHIDDDGGHRLVRGPAAAVMRGWWRPGFVRCRGAVSAGHSRTA